MQEYALYAIAGSVLMHVAWNLLARHVSARCNFLWWGLLVHLLAFGPWAFYTLATSAHWDHMLVVTIIVSSICNAIYFLALRKAYTYAPVSLVYPVARSSPILIAAWSTLFFQHQIAIQGWAGISISIAGLLLMGWANRDGQSRNAINWSLLAALCTSIYSISDKIAVVHLPDFGSKMGFISVGYAISFALLCINNHRENGHCIPACRPRLRYLVPGGLMVGSAYALVIHAMQWIHAAYVVAYTNAGIVIATLISILWIGERQSWKSRLAAAGIITSGLVIISIRN